MSDSTETNWYDSLFTPFLDDDGDLDWSKVLAGGQAGVGLMSLLGLGGSAFQGNTSAPTGYQGSIPKYDAVRTRVPADPYAKAGYGRRYFSDVQYVPREEQDTDSQTDATQGDSTGAQGGSAGASGGSVIEYAQGGIASINQNKGGIASISQDKGYYLDGPTDGMADEVPATIDGQEEARLSEGEFVVAADVVSGLGNGNSKAGAEVLYAMMDKVRKARTGTKKQGKQINPEKMIPKVS